MRKRPDGESPDALAPLRSRRQPPASSTRRLTSGADALLIDLEDSVALAAKDEARGVTRGVSLRETQRHAERPRLYRARQRLDDRPDRGRSRRRHAGRPRRHRAAEDGGRHGRVASRRQARRARGRVRPAPTAPPASSPSPPRTPPASSRSAPSPARATGSWASTWGGEDLSADLGAEANRDDDGAYTDPYRLARALTLLGAAAASVDAIDSVFTNFRDMAGLRAECREARRDGFVAKMAIHPAQVPIINEAFTPSPEAIERAQAVVDAFAANPGAGVVGVDGEMLDRPHLLRAERLLKRTGKH